MTGVVLRGPADWFDIRKTWSPSILPAIDVEYQPGLRLFGSPNTVFTSIENSFATGTVVPGSTIDDAREFCRGLILACRSAGGQQTGFAYQATPYGLTYFDCSGVLQPPGSWTNGVIKNIFWAQVSNEYLSASFVYWNHTNRVVSLQTLHSVIGIDSAIDEIDLSPYTDEDVKALLGFGPEFDLSNSTFQILLPAGFPSYSYPACSFDITNPGVSPASIIDEVTYPSGEGYVCGMIFTAEYSASIPLPPPGPIMTDDGPVDVDDPTPAPIIPVLIPPTGTYHPPHDHPDENALDPVDLVEPARFASRLESHDVAAILNTNLGRIQWLLSNLIDNGTDEYVSCTIDLNQQGIINLAEPSGDPDEIVRKS